MDTRERLGANLLAEGRAYGYTLTVWGSGAMLIKEFGLPTHGDVFAFAGGALAGMALLAAIAFDGLFGTEVSRPGRERPAASLVHVAAALGNLALSYGVVVAASGRVPGLWAYLAVGFQATVAYNALLLFEDRAAYALS